MSKWCHFIYHFIYDRIKIIELSTQRTAFSLDLNWVVPESAGQKTNNNTLGSQMINTTFPMYLLVKDEFNNKKLKRRDN